jgi:hypothetical protein
MPTWAAAQPDPQPCNASVLCHPSYAAQAASVVRILAGQFGATGFLIRNPIPGGNPFVLTSFHTFDFNRNNVLEPNELETINDQVQFRFDDNSPCGATNIPGRDERGATWLGGSILRVASDNQNGNDYVLLELRSPAPFTANYANLKFVQTTQGGSFVIHHPRSTTKRIGFGSNNGISSSGYFNVTMSDGRPALASSGGPLFDNDDRKVYAYVDGGPCGEGCDPPDLETCNPYDFISLYDAWFGSFSSGGVSSLGWWLSGGGGGSGNPNDPPPPPPAEYAGGVPSSITGPSVVCSIAKFELPAYPNGLPPGLTLAWEVSSNLQIVSTTPNGIFVQPNFNATQTGGPGFVTAAVTNAAVILGPNVHRSRLDVQVGTPANTPITITNQANGTSFTTGQGGSLVLCAGQQNILLATYGGPGGLAIGVGQWQFPAGWGVPPALGNSASVAPFGTQGGNIVFFPANACGQSVIPAVVPATLATSGGPCGRGTGFRMAVWPNPADDGVVVELPTGKQGEAPVERPEGLRLYSAMGVEVRAEGWPAGGYSARLDVRGLPPGVYVLHVQFAGRVEVHRLVVGKPSGLSN